MSRIIEVSVIQDSPTNNASFIDLKFDGPMREAYPVLKGIDVPIETYAGHEAKSRVFRGEHIFDFSMLLVVPLYQNKDDRRDSINGRKIDEDTLRIARNKEPEPWIFAEMDPILDATRIAEGLACKGGVIPKHFVKHLEQGIRASQRGESFKRIYITSQTATER